MTRATRQDYDRVCQLLTTLTAEQLAQVRLRAKFLEDGVATPVARAAPVVRARAKDDYDWLAKGIEHELRRRGLIGSGRLAVERIAPNWASASEAARADLREHLERGGHKWQHPWVALGRVAARVLADYLAAGRVPVTPRTMLSNADKILLALDRQFPGYVASGMLHCCLDPRLVGE